MNTKPFPTDDLGSLHSTMDLQSNLTCPRLGIERIRQHPGMPIEPMRPRQH
ncbi:hypothetical protein XF_1393 [Xylella fastidiosa 9a5c]|uniref:Uncharacterized protein n=1 Tax=Xylella fastidiosa (strain 9a5c) TaxID=160492 RepID=Q9PDI6_XYLFA|nr:hypothetical protein XF_1393 [Xylella fastidiosa 9a5c]